MSPDSHTREPCSRLSGSSWLCNKILQSSMKHNHEAKSRRCRQFPMESQLAVSQPGDCRQIPYIGSERKISVRNAGEHYKHREEKSGVTLRPVEIPPLCRIWHSKLSDRRRNLCICSCSLHILYSYRFFVGCACPIWLRFFPTFTSPE